jgi:hypothetical protein
MDVAGQKVTAEVLLDFVPWLLEFTPDGTRLIVYGSSYTNEITPQVALLDAADLHLLWEQPLPQVRHGDYPLAGAQGEHPETENIRPAYTLSPDRRYLYLVHADEEKLTRVDFVDRTVTTGAVAAAQGWPDWFFSLTAREAYAKSANGTSKQGLLSPDGSRFYVVGYEYHWVEGENGQGDIVGGNLGGLQVIDPGTGALLAQVESEAMIVDLSFDGQQLYLWGETQGEVPEARLAVLDANTLATLKSLEDWTLSSTRRLDGQPVLVGYSFGPSSSFKTAGFDPETLEPLESFTGTILEPKN